jgi:taurine dioxygenase
MTPRWQIDFANLLGKAAPPEPSKGLTTHEGEHPEVQWLAAMRADGSPPPDRRPTQADVWHTDYSYLAEPPELSFLYGVEIPVDSPDTLYVNMQHAYETLPKNKQDLYEGWRAIHTQKGGLDPQIYRLPPYIVPGEAPDERLCAERSAIHPLVRIHPVTGKKFFYMSQCYTVGLEGVPPAEGREIIADIYRHALPPDTGYRHVWRNGDCVISDNMTTNHRRSRPLSTISAPRTLSRVMVYLDTLKS